MLSTPCKTFTLVGALAALYANHAALALEQPPLETLVVTATRTERPWLGTPGAVTDVPTDAQLPGLRMDSAEILQGVAGLQVDSRSNYAQDTRLVLRGFGARSAFGVRGMDVRLNDIPLAMPDGQAQLGSVLLDEVTSVEVLRGPLASLYGNGAGGVIRLKTEAPKENQLRIGASAGSHDSERQVMSGAWRGGAWALRAQGSRLKSDGFRPHSAMERDQAGVQLYYQGPEGFDASLRVDGSRDPETQDPSGLSPDQWREDPEQVSDRILLFNTRKQISHRQVSLDVGKALHSGKWRLAAWQGQRDIDQWLPFHGDDIESSGAVIDLQREFSGAQLSYRHNTKLANEPLSVTLGTTLERMKDTRRGYVNDFGDSGALRRDEVGTVGSTDVYSLLEWNPAAKLSVLGGLRHSRSDFEVDDHFITPGNPDDSGSLNFGETSAAMGLSYQVNEQWAAFSSVGRGFETPTLTEMAYRNDGTGLNTTLSPSTNVQLEGGVRFDEQAVLQGALTAFRVDSDDELVVDQSQGGRTTYYNAAATERSGLELEGTWRFAPGVSARGSATWLNAEYSEGEWSGNRLPGVAKSQAYAQLQWQPWHSPAAVISIAGRYRSRVATSDDNDVWAPDYVTFDLAVTSEHRWLDSQVEGWLRIDNLSNEKYVGSVIVNQGSGRSFEPAAGRTFTAGIEIRI